MCIGLSQCVLVCLLFVIALSGVTQLVSQFIFLSIGLEQLSPYGLHSIVWWVSNLRASNLSNLEPMDAELDMWTSGCRTCVIGHHVPRHQCLMLSRSLLLTSADSRFYLSIRFDVLYFILPIRQIRQCMLDEIMNNLALSFAHARSNWPKGLFAGAWPIRQCMRV